MSSWSSSTLVFVRDVDASIRFYVDTLGFTLNMRHEEAGRALVAGVSHGEGCAFLLTCQWPDRIGSGIIYIALGPETFDALRADLESKNVAIKEGWWGDPLLIVEDCDGNQIYLPRP